MKVLADFFYKILIVCICFEEMFARMWLPFKYLKYALVPVLLIAIVVKVKGRIKIPKIEKVVWLFMLFTCFVAFGSMGDFVSIDKDGLEVVKKYAFIPFLFLCFYYSNLFKVESSKLLVFFSQSMVLFSVLSVLLFFFRIPIWNDFQRFYWGRITVAYPTIDAVNCVIAISIIVFSKSNLIPFFHKLVGSFMLIVFTLIQTSGTGIFLLFCLFVFEIIVVNLKYRLSNNDASDIKKIIAITTLGIAISLSFFCAFLRQYDASLFENMMLQVENRVAIMTNMKNNELDLNTMESRDDKFEKAQRLYLKNRLDRIFGVGFGMVSYDPQKHFSGSRVFLESQWHLELFSAGYVGVFLMFLMFADIFQNMVRTHRENLYSLFGLFAIFISLFTSCTFMSFALTGAFTLLYAEQKQTNMEKRKTI